MEIELHIDQFCDVTSCAELGNVKMQLLNVSGYGKNEQDTRNRF